MVQYPICRVPPRARYLPLRYADKALGKTQSSYYNFASEPEELGPGQERLYSFYQPPLAAGRHTISTKQVVTQDSKAQLLFQDEQQFNVVAPRYSLPDGSVHSVYPPQGHADNCEILPHVVLNDPHLPWIRKVVNADPTKDRNRVPWLALLTFSQEELKATDLGLQMSNTLAANMSLGELGKMSCSTPVLNKDGKPWDGDSPETKADFIFVRKELFRALFKSYEDKEPTKHDVSRYSWLSHMRHINTVGMANSGIDGERGSFGVVVSQRAGPLDVTTPTDLMVHLVSIEHVPQLEFPLKGDRVALCSLESWSYTCLPANSFNVYDGLQHIGNTLDLLRADPGSVEKGHGKPLPARLRRRLTDGYLMTRYRVQTGEETAAWIRGPFVPTIVEHIERPISRSGTELQVLDRETAIMDVTYSVAWQLGKTLAVADQAFATALGRLRLVVSRKAIDAAKKRALSLAGVFESHAETLARLTTSSEHLVALDPAALLAGPDIRWRSPPSISVDLSLNGSIMRKHFQTEIAPIVEAMAASADAGYVYNEFNEPLSPDWMIVLSWVLDRMYLSGIPYQYYLPDPAYLPPESLKFFHIDRNWVDALIDGALSIANHLPVDNVIPGQLKKQINEYLKQHPKGLSYPPKRPSFGFLLRSELCVKFPDLIVQAYRRGAKEPDPTLILRQENIAEGILLVMFDQRPGGPVLERLVLREPPHQQAFSAGASLKPGYLEIAYKKIFTIPLAEQEKRPHRTHSIAKIQHYPDGTEKELPDGTDSEKRKEGLIFTWQDDGTSVHSLRLPAYAKRVHKVLGRMGSDYTETDPTATLLGIQLNHPMYYLEMCPKKGLFPLLSHIHGDDGTLEGLKMMETPQRVPSIASDDILHVSGAEDGEIDWFAPFVPNTDELYVSYSSNSESGPPQAPHVLLLSASEAREDADLEQAGKRPEYGVSTEGGYLDYELFPLTDPSSKKKVHRLDIRQDLVFSLPRIGGVPGWDLERVNIYIPYGKPIAGRPTLMDRYDGVGTVMITDFRFNVVLTLSRSEEPTEETLVVTLVPRGKPTAISTVNNLSFLLSGMLVSDYSGWTQPGSTAEVTIHVSESYKGRDVLKDKMKLEVTFK